MAARSRGLSGAGAKYLRRRFKRLTRAFGRKAEFHLYAVALRAMFYNRCRPHQTPTKKRKAILARRPWTVEDLPDLLDGR